jgi:hypothetical protein
MKQTLCEAWKMRLRKVYDNDLEQFRAYDRVYNIAKRLGYDNADVAWEINPIISGSIDPATLKVIKEELSFKEKLQRFLKEDENFDKATPTPIEKLNDEPEKRTEPEEKPKMENIENLNHFLDLANPVSGSIKCGSLFQYVKEFRRRNKDILIMKGKDASEAIPFYGVDRGDFTAYLASVLDNEEALKDIKTRIEKVYTTEQSELAMDDYIDMLKGKITIHNNPGTKMEVEGPSKDIPGNVMKTMEEK